MRRKLLIISILLLYACTSTGQITNQFYFSNTQILPKGKWESGLIQPFRIGISESSEIYASIITMPLIPNVGIKKLWQTEKYFSIASMHSVSVPSPFLNITSAKGVGGLIPPEFEFPFILSISNSILFSRQIFSKQLYTIKGGYTFAVKSANVNPLATIDLPLFYPRMAHYYKGTEFRFEVNISGPLVKKIYYEQGCRIFVITRAYHNFFFENNGFLFFKLFKSSFLKTGYILSYGNYPYGSKWQLWPAIDFLFGNALKN